LKLSNPLHHVNAAEFQAIMLAQKRTLIVPADTKVVGGKCLRIHLEGQGSGPPYLDCLVTYVEDIEVGFVDSVDEGLVVEASLLLSIKRGISW